MFALAVALSTTLLVRARAGARVVASRAGDGAQGRRSRRRPPRPCALDPGRHRSGDRMPAADRIGTADRELRAHPEPAKRFRVRRRVDVLGAASWLPVSGRVGSGHRGPTAHAHPGRARRRIGRGQSVHAVQRLFENDPVPARPSDRSRERAGRRPTLHFRRLLPHRSASRSSPAGRSPPPIAPAARRSRS